MSSPTLLRSAQQYMALRRALGFRLDMATWYLPDFVAFLSRHGSSVITTELALRWAQQLPGTSPSTWAKRLSTVRGFAMHLRALDPRTEVPPRDVVPWRTQRVTPYIYTEQEVRALMREARGLPPPLRGATCSTVIGLLATTGMRLGEALGLDDRDVDWSRSLLLVRRGKFQKTRLVPLHASALAALRQYRVSRDRLISRRSSVSFFVSSVGTRLHRKSVECAFIQLLRLTGISRVTGRRPRLHDLRHYPDPRIIPRGRRVRLRGRLGEVVDAG